jgi:hypothetical protein
VNVSSYHKGWPIIIPNVGRGMNGGLTSRNIASTHQNADVPAQQATPPAPGIVDGRHDHGRQHEQRQHTAVSLRQHLQPERVTRRQSHTRPANHQPTTTPTE